MTPAQRSNHVTGYRYRPFHGALLTVLVSAAGLAACIWLLGNLP